jgi:predicted Zn-dependent protease
MQRLTRGDSGDLTPTYLQTHPLGTTRLAEARDRAERLRREAPASAPRPATGSGNLLLPAGLQPAGPVAVAAPVRQFEWARERLRVLTAGSSEKAVRESRSLLEDAGAAATDAQRYGLALAYSRNGFPAAAEDSLLALAKAHPDNLFIGLALADNASVARNEALARQRYESLLARHSDDRTVILTYAEALNAAGTAEAGRRAQEILRPILPANAEDPLFQKSFGRASELAGDLARAGEAFAEAAWLNGRAEDALNQFNALLRRTDLSYIQRSRIEARIAEITPEVLEMQRRKIRPQDLPADGR